MAAKYSSAAAARAATGSRSDRPARSGLRSADFDAVYRDGARRAAAHFLVLARPNGLNRPRLGISVKSALGGAVVRNRIRRRIRALLQRLRPPAGWDIVIQPRTSEVARGDFAALEDELRAALAALSPA